MKKFPILYTRNTNGSINQWQVVVEGDEFYTIEGLVGKGFILTTSKPTKCEIKNLGKKNETSGKEQALKEAKARHKKQLENNYFEKIEDIDKLRFFEPMTCQKYRDFSDRIIFPCCSQPKLDGMRCVVDINGMWSRHGKPIVSAPHIYNILFPLLEKYPELKFDGELYHHKEGINFEKIISLARKTKPTQKDLIESEKYLQFWVFDLFHSQLKWNFVERSNQLYKLLLLLNNPKIIFVETLDCTNNGELDVLYQRYLSEGFEGQIIRNAQAVYQNKRTIDIIKRKEFIDEEFELLDLKDGVGNKVNIATTATFKHPNGEIFDAGMIGSELYCKELLKNKNKYIGKYCTVRYQNLTEDKKVPRFGKMVIVRNYE